MQGINLLNHPIEIINYLRVLNVINITWENNVSTRNLCVKNQFNYSSILECCVYKTYSFFLFAEIDD